MKYLDNNTVEIVFEVSIPRHFCGLTMNGIFKFEVNNSEIVSIIKNKIIKADIFKWLSLNFSALFKL